VAGQRPRDFRPYTIKDYKIIQPQEYYELGGLGAYNLGTEDWRKRKELLDRRTDYANQVKDAHKALPPAKQRRPKRHPEKPLSGRQKALEFARNIPRPRMKVKE
jgi:hypothetical protein